MATTIGTNGFTEQPQRQRKLKGRGWVTYRTWHGPRSGVDDFVNGTVLSLEPEEIDVNKGTPAVVVASFPDEITNVFAGDPITEAEAEAIWELIPTPLDKALATHPTFNQSGATPVVIERIEQALREGTATDTDWVAEYGFNGMNDYRNLRVKGVDSWRTWGWTIRKTISLGRAVDAAEAQVDTQKIVSYNEIGIPSDVKWAQPTYNRYIEGDSLNPELIDEWMAQPPEIRFVRNKYEIVKEWLGAVKWYSCLYEGGSAPSTNDGNY